MSVNRYLPHIFVIPEDDANVALANGFHLEIDPLKQRQLQVLPPAGGWSKAVDTLLETHIGPLTSNPHRFIVLLMDFDNDERRRTAVLARIPASVRDRVFVFGSLDEVEPLRSFLHKTPENIGRQVAQECRDGRRDTLSTEHLVTNLEELDRMPGEFLEILF